MTQGIAFRMARPLTLSEKDLIHWMLEHGHPEGRSFLPQLEQVTVDDWRCPCGCASINLTVAGVCHQTGSLHILAEFCFGGPENVSGIFVYEKQGSLAGLEIYGLSGNAPAVLPQTAALKPFEA